jgi:septum site-determining protein MinD
MTRVVSFHSNRGGVGKTLIATNLAMAYAKLGRTACLLDLDFRAPSLSAVLQLSPKLWINEALNTNVAIWEALIDASSKYGTKGRLLIGLTNPSLDSIRDMAGKDKQREIKTLKQLFSLKRELSEKGVEYLLFDTSPGILYSSVNAVACSDVVICVTTADILDIEETQRIIVDLYRAFEKPTYIFLNKVIPRLQWKETNRNAMLEKYSKLFTTPILSIVPCYCDLLNSRMRIYTLTTPNHPFSKAIYDAAHMLSETKCFQ